MAESDQEPRGGSRGGSGGETLVGRGLGDFSFKKCTRISGVSICTHNKILGTNFAIFSVIFFGEGAGFLSVGFGGG